MIGMPSKDVVRLHVLLDQADTLLGAVGGGDWQPQGGPWCFAAAAWRARFEELRKGLSTVDSGDEDVEIRELGTPS